jgi:uncharacterized protein YbaR (Trm112 family)
MDQIKNEGQDRKGLETFRSHERAMMYGKFLTSTHCNTSYMAPIEESIPITLGRIM